MGEIRARSDVQARFIKSRRWDARASAAARPAWRRLWGGGNVGWLGSRVLRRGPSPLRGGPDLILRKGEAAVSEASESGVSGEQAAPFGPASSTAPAPTSAGPPAARRAFSESRRSGPGSQPEGAGSGCVRASAWNRCVGPASPGETGGRARPRSSDPALSPGETGGPARHHSVSRRNVRRRAGRAPRARARASGVSPPAPTPVSLAARRGIGAAPGGAVPVRGALRGSARQPRAADCTAPMGARERPSRAPPAPAGRLGELAGSLGSAWKSPGVGRRGPRAPVRPGPDPGRDSRRPVRPRPIERHTNRVASAPVRRC